MPAMVRTRQKGRRVALVSMRRGCNRDLYEGPKDSNNNLEHNHNIRDYDVVWIEDYLDELIKPRSDQMQQKQKMKEQWALSEFTALKVISDFISKSDLPHVNSRDLGRYLKTIVIGENCLLDEIKAQYGGIYQFLSTSDCFYTQAKTTREERLEKNPSFWIGLASDADVALMKAAKSAKLSDEEKQFFDTYSLDGLAEDNTDVFFFSLRLKGRLDPSLPEPRFQSMVFHERTLVQKDATEKLQLPEELTQDYNELTVTKLKDVCRSNGLKVSGTKQELLDRVREFVDKKIALLRNEHKQRQKQEKGSDDDSAISNGNNDEIGYLENLVHEYLHAKGGKATSRDLGRYLSVNKASPKRLAVTGNNVRVTALNELKECHGSLVGFVYDRPDLFERQEFPESEYPDDDQAWQHTFYVVSKQRTVTPNKKEVEEIAASESN